ncbi:MAG: hypothetical protein Kow00124_29770 [Anaerolineae bacterium]
MDARIRLPIYPGRNVFRFPDRCVYCSGPHEATLLLGPLVRLHLAAVSPAGAGSVNRAYVRYLIEGLEVPYCRQHAREAGRNRIILTGLYLLGAAAAVLLLFTAFAGRDPRDLAGDSWNLALLLVAVGAGLMGWMYVAWRGLGLIWPSLRHMPMLPTEQGGLGFEYRISLDEGVAEFRFANPEIARVFLRLNAVR